MIGKPPNNQSSTSLLHGFFQLQNVFPKKKRHFSRPSLVATELHAISAPLGADPHVFDDNLL